MIRFILLTFGILLFVLILATLIVNPDHKEEKLNDHKEEKLKKACPLIMVPINNIYIVYPCTTEYERGT